MTQEQPYKVEEEKIQDEEVQILDDEGNLVEQPDQDKPLSIIPIAKIFDKNLALEKDLVVQIVSFGHNKWKKPVLKVKLSGDSEVYVLNINATIQNAIVEDLGPIPREWADQSVIFYGKAFDKIIKNERKKGVELQYKGKAPE